MNDAIWFFFWLVSLFGMGWICARFYYRRKYYPLFQYKDARDKEEDKP